MRFRSNTVFACIFASACAAAGVGLPFEFQPTEVPHSYDVEVTGDILAETPMGRMASETSSSGTVLLEVGERQDEGWRIAATYEALEVRAEGSLGGGSVSTEGILGKAYTGVLSRSGQISITDSPAVSGRLADNLDPAALFTELLAPLPPPGQLATDSWPVSSTVVSDAAVRLTSVFEGTARHEGDTVWNGIPARLIVAEGTLQIEGGGAPSGAPVEMDLVLSGESSRLYIWDAIGRVMLASLVTGEADGTLSVRGMGMSIPATFSTRQEVTLRR